MKQLIILALALTVTGVSDANAQEFMRIWPDGNMPNSKGIAVNDSISGERIWQVGIPGMWTFFPSVEENRGGAVIILPGGGYQRLAYVKSGLQLAKWFNTFGITALVLKYRLPHSPDLKERAIAPMQDAQRAMRIVRANATRWGINPEKIGVLGTSAGGHLASTMGTHFEDVSAVGDSLDKFSYRPNFLILISPVIDLGTYAHVGSRDNLLGPNPSRSLIDAWSNQLHVARATPPTFLVHAVNDKTVPLRNSLMFYQALVDSSVSASFHVFPHGAHSIALRDNPGSTELWSTLCEIWMKEMRFVEAKE